jgi:hypothetical protein
MGVHKTGRRGHLCGRRSPSLQAFDMVTEPWKGESNHAYHTLSLPKCNRPSIGDGAGFYVNHIQAFPTLMSEMAVEDGAKVTVWFQITPSVNPSLAYSDIAVRPGSARCSGSD